MGRRLTKSSFFFTIIIILMFFVSFGEVSIPAQAQNCSSSIIMRADTLEILKGNNYKVRLPMASTTKVMTALLICENCFPDEKIKIPKEAVGIEGS